MNVNNEIVLSAPMEEAWKALLALKWMTVAGLIDVVFNFRLRVDQATFAAELNGGPLAVFSPAPGTSQTVTILLSPGRNVLALSVDGTLADGRRASDRDRLTFIVG